MAELSWQQLMEMAEQAGGAAEVVPDGTYGAVIDSAEYATAQSGADMIKVKFKITDMGPYQNKPVYNNFVLSPDNATALGIFRRHMDALGIPPSYVAALPEPKSVGMAVLAEQLPGRHASIVVGHKPWQGRNRNEVNDVKPPTQGAAPGVPGAVPPPAPQPSPAPVAPVPPAPTAPVAPAPAVQQSPVYTPPPQAPAPAPAPQQQPVAPAPAPAPQPAQMPVAAPQQPAPAPAPAPEQQSGSLGAPPF